MKGRFGCSLILALVTYVFMRFLFFMISPHANLLESMSEYVAVIAFIVAFIAYGVGESNSRK